MVTQRREKKAVNLSDEERERIAREYGVEVPRSVGVQVIPRGVTALPPTYTRKEAVRRVKDVIRRGWKFQNAKRKRDAAERRNGGD